MYFIPAKSSIDSKLNHEVYDDVKASILFLSCYIFIGHKSWQCFYNIYIYIIVNKKIIIIIIKD